MKPSELYTPERMKQFGKIYHGLLKSIGAKNDPYPQSDAMPWKAIVMVFPSAARAGIPESINSLMAELCESITPEESDELMNTPAPMNVRHLFFFSGE